MLRAIYKLSWIFLLICLCAPAFADLMGSTLSFSVGSYCNNMGTSGADTSTITWGGSTWSGVSCWRTSSMMTCFTGLTGGTIQNGYTVAANTQCAIHTGDVLVTKPLLNPQTFYESQPAFTMSSSSPTGTQAVVWLQTQFNANTVPNWATRGLAGTATIDSASAIGITVTKMWNVTGTCLFNCAGGSDATYSGSWASGVFTVAGDNTSCAQGMVARFTSQFSGVGKCSNGPNYLYFPAQTLTGAQLAGRTYKAGLSYNSSHTDGIDDHRYVRAVASSWNNGMTFTVTPYTDPETEALDTAPIDTLTLAAADLNQPSNGLFMVSATRAGVSGTKYLVCAANVSGSYGTRVFCSGQSPADSSIGQTYIFNYNDPPGTYDTTYNNGSLTAFSDDGNASPSPSGAGTGTVAGGSNGIASIGLKALKIQSDGKLVVAGSVQTGGAHSVARYNTNGTLDTSFNSADSTGAIMKDWVLSQPDRLNDMAIDGNGNIVTVGQSWNSSKGNDDTMIARYTSAGVLDTTNFNSPNGFQRLNWGSGGSAGSAQDEFLGVYVDASNNAFAVGYSTLDGTAPERNTILAKYSSTGAQVTTGWGTSGKAVHNLASAASKEDAGVAIISDGGTGFYIAGYGVNSETTPNRDFMVARITSAGALDTANFGGGTGKVLTDIEWIAGSNGDSLNYSTGNVAYAIARYASGTHAGKIVVAGETGTTNAYKFAVARYSATGVLDTNATTGFGPGKTGIAVTNVGGTTGNAFAYTLAIQPDDKIILGGKAKNASGDYDWAFVRYLANGELDTSFGTGGKFLLNSGTGFDDELRRIVLRSDGRIVGAGITRGNWGVGVLWP